MQDKKQQKQPQRQPYTAPAIVYESTLTTRAGSRPDGLAPDRGKDVAPEKLFGGS